MRKNIPLWVCVCLYILATMYFILLLGYGSILKRLDNLELKMEATQAKVFYNRGGDADE